MVRLALDSPACFINREASWLNFNWRVLEEAQDTRNPLLERVKFLAITASNLDEFFEVRVGGLLQQLEDGNNATTPDGLTMVEEKELINRETHQFVEEQYACWNERLRPELAEQGIRVLGMDQKGLWSVVTAQAPLAEIQRYATDLRSSTQGRGTFTMEFDHYNPLPQSIAEQVIGGKEKVAVPA